MKFLRIFRVGRQDERDLVDTIDTMLYDLDRMTPEEKQRLGERLANTGVTCEEAARSFRLLGQSAENAAKEMVRFSAVVPQEDL